MVILSGGFVGEWLHGPQFIILIGVQGLVGLALLWFGRGEAGRLRQCLMLTGGASTGFLVGVVLHNLCHALSISTRVAALAAVAEGLDVLFFGFAVFLCPLALLVGVVGSLWHLLRRS